MPFRKVYELISSKNKSVTLFLEKTEECGKTAVNCSL